MTLSWRKTSAVMCAACILLTGATACNANKDGGKKVKTTVTVMKTVDEKPAAAKQETDAEQTVADETVSEKTLSSAKPTSSGKTIPAMKPSTTILAENNGASEIPCFTTDVAYQDLWGKSPADLDSLHFQPIQSRVLWDNEGGFTIMNPNPKLYDTIDFGGITVASTETSSTGNGPAVTVRVLGDGLTALYTVGLGGGMQDESQRKVLRVTRDGDRLEVNAPEDFVKGIPADQVFAGIVWKLDDKLRMDYCAKSSGTVKEVMKAQIESGIF